MERRGGNDGAVGLQVDLAVDLGERGELAGGAVDARDECLSRLGEQEGGRWWLGGCTQEVPPCVADARGPATKQKF